MQLNKYEYDLVVAHIYTIQMFKYHILYGTTVYLPTKT